MVEILKESAQADFVFLDITIPCNEAFGELDFDEEGYGRK